ncbi:MAG: hydroxymethylglutaryl-CoA lyase [Chitinophagaceae bacterium]|nr:hydroxymethylglutaryl-CoA lyase [Chitinophagaceae bacterium]MCW5925908.1 hydroxymethylglutaryl-CoA lyase [Chitinophagaceae bacterium]
MNTGNTIKIIECPRDAMQGWKSFIPTERKAAYLNALLKAGFDTLDFGSFVSPKAIPQMADTAQVLSKLDLNGASTKLLAIVANVRGAEDALQFEEISYLGFPFSVSPVFQQRNTNSTIEESLLRVTEIQQRCEQKNRELVIYISMGFGNPYGDPYNEDIVYEWVKKITALGIKIVSLADTVGLATPEVVRRMTGHLVEQFPETTIGVHLHSSPANRTEKLKAALDAGCRRFDGAINGIGGCPMADDELVGNIDTVEMVHYFKSLGFSTGVREAELGDCMLMANTIFV